MQKDITAYARAADRPHRLLDHLRAAHKLPNDAELARRAGIQPPTISKIRGGAVVTDAVLVRLHEAFGITFPDMRAMLAPEPEAEAGAA